MTSFSVRDFPPADMGKDINILLNLEDASSKLAFLDALQRSLPNPNLILKTLHLQEAQDSSEIENIMTTNDELYQARAGITKMPIAAKEVASYLRSAELGIEKMKQEKGIISMNNILAIQQEIEGNKAGIRSQAGTVIKNQNTGEVIYTPPQDPTEIKDLMQELLEYINLDSGEHPLIKMALIHHQFESIHPFFDGNGRTGRILNLLYLIQAKRLSLPVLYLSRFINHNKSEYYRLLQAVRNESSWKEWVIYMLTGIAMTAAHTTDLINQIQDQFTAHKDKIRSNYKFYSHELLNHIYAYPYTRISFFSEELNVGRPTATKYLNQLSSGGILTKVEKNNRFYYINHKLYDILTKTPSLKISNSQ